MPRRKAASAPAVPEIPAQRPATVPLSREDELELANYGLQVQLLVANLQRLEALTQKRMQSLGAGRLACFERIAHNQGLGTPGAVLALSYDLDTEAHVLRLRVPRE
jgi:hypothetical protein